MKIKKNVIVLVMILFVPFLYALQETGKETRKQKDIETHPALIHLKQQLKEAPDAEKSALLNQIAFYYRGDKKLADSLLETAQQALELAGKYQQEDQEIEAMLNVARGRYLKGENASALSMAEEGLKRVESLNNHNLVVAALEEVGEIGLELPAPKKSFSAYLRLREIYLKAGIKDKAARSSFAAARANLKSDRPDSLKIGELLQEAADLYESLGMIDRAVPVYPYQVESQLTAGLAEDAARISREAEIGVAKTGSALLTGRFYLELGDVYRKHKQYNEAEHWLQKGMQSCSGFKDSSWKGVLLISLGKLKQEMKEYDQALEYLESAKKLDWTKNRHGDEREREIEGFITEVKKEKRENLPWWGALTSDGLSGMEG